MRAKAYNIASYTSWYKGVWVKQRKLLCRKKRDIAEKLQYFIYERQSDLYGFMVWCIRHLILLSAP